MTTLLEKVIKEVSQLPEAEQDELASVILEELASEQKWSEAFEKSKDKLAKLSDEAIKELLKQV